MKKYLFILGILLLATLVTANVQTSTKDGVTIIAPETTTCKNLDCSVPYTVCNQNENATNYTPSIKTAMNIEALVDTTATIAMQPARNLRLGNNEATTEETPLPPILADETSPTTLDTQTCNDYELRINPLFGTTNKYDINWLDPFIDSTTYSSNFATDANTTTTTTTYTTTITFNQTSGPSDLAVYSYSGAGYQAGNTIYPANKTLLTINAYEDAESGISVMPCYLQFNYNDTTQTNYSNTPNYVSGVGYQLVQYTNPYPTKPVINMTLYCHQGSGTAFSKNLTTTAWNASANTYNSLPLTTSGNLSSVTPLITYNTGSNSTSANITLSCNGGTNWTGTLTNNTITTCPVAGSTLLYKIILNTTQPTATINQLDLLFTLGGTINQLNFTANTTGQIQHANGGPVNFSSNTSGYSQATYKYTQSASTYADGELLSINYNQQTNPNLTQKYMFYNDYTNGIDKTLLVDTGIDTPLYLNIQDAARGTLLNSIITFYTWNDTSTITTDYSTAQIAGRYITQGMSDTASPGEIAVINSQRAYTVTIESTGYTTKTLLVRRGIDLNNEGKLTVTLIPSAPATPNYTASITGPLHYTTETNLTYTITYLGTQPRYYSINSGTKGLLNLTYNSGTITLLNGTAYTTGNNFTIELWKPTYDANGNVNGQTQEQQLSITYLAPINEAPYPRIDNQLTTSSDNKTLIMGILLIIVILVSSVMGYALRKSGADTGYYIFNGSMIILGIIYTAWLFVSVISGLAIVARLLKKNTED